MEDPHFWDNPEEATKKQRLLGNLKNDVETYNKLVSDHDDIRDMIEMADEEPDPSIVPEVEEMFEDFKNKFETLRMKTLLSGEYDDCNAIVTLHAGTGGTEAMDWTGMLYRMYSRWAESHGFQVEVLDSLDGDEAGLKSITFQVNGENAYGLLKSEHGVHRLVRISPFNANGKRQTSFSACEVMPDIEEDLDIEIDPKDIRIDTYRSSGAGGQHINKTDSAVRMKHIPTGLMAFSQSERSQILNREKCLSILKAKLYQKAIEDRENEKRALKGEQRKIEWGSQIRSYIFCPYTLVKDHRTNYEEGNVDKVMNGEINNFLFAYLKSQI